VDLHPAVVARLERLAPDQRAAATAPPGPVLCVAPAGSGKTTTLVARIAWLIASGASPDSICAVTFNKRAAEELSERLSAALLPLGVPAGAVRVRTFHALGREILRSAGVPVEPLVDRAALLRRLFPGVDAVRLRWLDDRMSRLKLDRGLRLEDAAGVADGADGAAEPGLAEFVSGTRRRSGRRAGSTSTISWSERCPCSSRRSPISLAGGRPVRTCWSTRCRTSTGRSFGSRCTWPRRRTACSSSATTTSRSMAGAWPT
jgi:hypothetical protein